MVKYIDAEKLIAEIKRRISSWSIREKFAPVGQGKDTCISRVTELSDLLSFINSLQQEQQEVDLEKDVESWFFNEISHKINVEHTMYHYFQECAQRYFELGKNSK